MCRLCAAKSIHSLAEGLSPVQKNRFHNKWQYLYIESICNDPQVLEQNYRYKMMYSPDYKDVNTDEVSCYCMTHSASSVFVLACAAYIFSHPLGSTIETFLQVESPVYA